MRSSVLLFVIVVAGCVAPPRPTVEPFADGNQWVLHDDLIYELLDSPHEIHVRRGFVTDFASVPRFAWLAPDMTPTGPLGRAGVIHDFLYWDQGCSREVADKIMLLAMIESDVSTSHRDVVYRALRAFGGSTWSWNEKQREAGQPRHIPDDYRETWATPHWRNRNWQEFQAFLVQKGVPPLPQTTPSYCTSIDDLLKRASCSWWRRLIKKCS